MSGREHFVIVGASLAGLRAAEALRDGGFDGLLTIVGDEPHEPYDRPPLSKQVALGMVDAASTALPRKHPIDASWQLNDAATGLDEVGRAVILRSGNRVPYDRLLVATGAAARPWPVSTEAALQGVLTLRTREDAAKLRSALVARPRRTVVIGGGFNGSEVASACRALDLPVTVVERSETPLARAFGHVVGRTAAALQRAHGVDLRCGSEVERLEGDADGHVRFVHLSRGVMPIETDLVVVALGTVPNVGWLAGSELAVGVDGLQCDERCRALDRHGQVADNIFVAGDVASFPHPLFRRESRRIEHWSNAIEQGRIAARNMLSNSDEMQAHDAVPTFWSSQFDVSIKAVGVPAAGSEVLIVQGSLESGSFVALYGCRGRLVAAVTFDQGKWLQRYVPLIAQGASFPCPGGMDAPPSTAPLQAEFPQRAGEDGAFITSGDRPSGPGRPALLHPLQADAIVQQSRKENNL